MGIKKISLRTNKRFKVLFKDKLNYRIGIYIPEYTNIEQIKKLEKHNAVEAFLLLEGDINLVYRDKEKLKEIKLKKDELLIVDTYHNAYRPNGKVGVCLIIERDDIKTEFVKV